jgi:hypothetical protein
MEATAMKPYLPSGLVKPNADELKCGYDAESLTAMLRSSLPNDWEYFYEALLRARDRARICAEALAEFKRNADPDNLGAKKELRALTIELEESRCEERFAVSQLARVQTAVAL